MLPVFVLAWGGVLAFVRWYPLAFVAFLGCLVCFMMKMLARAILSLHAIGFFGGWGGILTFD